MGRSLQELDEHGMGKGGSAASRSLDEKLPYCTKTIDGSPWHAIHQFADFPGGFDQATRELANFEGLRVENWTDPTGDGDNKDLLKNYIRYWYSHTVEVHHRSCRAKCLQGIIAAQELPEGRDQEQAAAYLVKTWNRLEPVQKDLRDEEVPLYWEVCGGITRLLSSLQKEDQIDPFVDTNFAFFIRSKENEQVTHMAINMNLTRISNRCPPEHIYAVFQRRPTQSSEPPEREWQFVRWCTRNQAVQNGLCTRNQAVRNGLAKFRDLSDLQPAPFVGACEDFDPRIEIDLDDDTKIKHLMKNDGDRHGRVQDVFKKAGKSYDEKHQLMVLLNAIKTSVHFAKEDKGVARLQAFRDKRSEKAEMQFVLPLHILASDGDMPDLALAISTKKPRDDVVVEDYRDPNKFIYEVKTVLEPMMAYKNCRVLGRISQNWLYPAVHTTTAGAASGGGAAPPTGVAAQPPPRAGGTTFSLGQGAPIGGSWQRGQSLPPAGAAAEEQEAGAAAEDAAEIWYFGKIKCWGKKAPGSGPSDDWYGYIEPEKDLGGDVRFFQKEWESKFQQIPTKGGSVKFTYTETTSKNPHIKDMSKKLLHIKELSSLES